MDFSIVRTWWKDLDDGREKERYVFLPVDSARLRAAKNVDQVIIDCKAYHRLLDRLQDAHTDLNSPKIREKIALIAGVLSHVRIDTPNESLPKHFRKLAESSDSLELRFKRLLQMSNKDEVFIGMIRAVHLTNDKKRGRKLADVEDLARALYFWDDPNTKKRWAYDFY